MAAGKANYFIVYRNDSQLYATKTKEIALNTPPPTGSTIEDKRVFFISHEPDSDNIVVRRLPQKEVEAAELKHPKPKKKKEIE